MRPTCARLTLLHFYQRRATILSSDLKGATHLALDATVALSDIVESMHAGILRMPWSGIDKPARRTRGITGFVYRSIRRVSGWVGSGLDLTIAQTQPLLDRLAAEDGPTRDAVVAALNGVLGDHLAASGNPLATTMQLRRGGRECTQIDGGRTLLLIHGLCMNDAQWQRRGHDHGESLARDLGWIPVYLRYNSGLHVSTNGRELAERLEQWIANASQPVSELAIVGFSLGGLVARSACHYAKQAGHLWPTRLKHLVFLGTPHHGAPLERGGNAVESVLGMTRYSAPLAAFARLRSAGITDLHHGSLLDEDWKDVDRRQRNTRLPRMVPLPNKVRCTALAGTTGHSGAGLAERLFGDGLVPVASALGHHQDATRTLRLQPNRQWVGHGLNHLDLLNDPATYAELRRALELH